MDRDRNTDLLGLDEIRREVDRLATILPPFDKRLLPFYGAQHRDTCGAHVEVDNGEYHRYVLERGKEISRKSSPSLDDLLFWIFQSLTSNLS